MAITADKVLHTAHLARLELTPEQVQNFARDLERIMECVDQLREVDVTDVQPQTQFARRRDSFRKDRINKSNISHEAIATKI